MGIYNIDVYDSKDLICGETKSKGIIISRSDGEEVAISSAKFQVFNKSTNASVTELADATINGSSIYANIVAGNTKGHFYVEFTYTVAGWIGKVRLNYNVR